MAKDKTYHLIIVLDDETTLQSSDLVINDVKKAQEMFTQKIKEHFPSVSDETIEDALNEGYYIKGNTVIMYTEPYNIFGEDKAGKFKLTSQNDGNVSIGLQATNANDAAFEAVEHLGYSITEVKEG